MSVARDTHYLAAQQVVSGIVFPAGSTVHVNSYAGHVDFGSVPVPTAIAGLVLVGDFRLERRDMDDYAIASASGTLAMPTVIHGIPCSRGALIPHENTTRCILDRDFDFAGHMMARGAGIEIYRSPLDEPAVLQWGTLAQPELLYDVVWPAGTVIGGRIALSPGRMAHGDGPQGMLQICIAKGITLPLAGAVLHGMMAMTIEGGRRLLSQVCSILPAEEVTWTATCRSERRVTPPANAPPAMASGAGTILSLPDHQLQRDADRHRPARTIRVELKNLAMTIRSQARC